MVRRWFRLGWRVGVFLGLAVAFVKVVQSRRTSDDHDGDGWQPSPEPWVPATAPVITSTPASPRPQTPTMAAPASEAPASEAPAPTPPATPAPAALAKRVAPTKATAPSKKATAKAPSVARQTVAKAATARSRQARTAKATPAEAWVVPNGDQCPPSHPVKVKLSSRIFHLPGMFAYERTRPDRCYADDAGATRDGFTRAKR